MVRTYQSPVREQQAERTRQGILVMASRLFAENSYQTTAVKSIAQAAGVAEGVIYHYFPDGKKQILTELFEQGLAAGFSRIADQNRALERLSLREIFDQLLSAEQSLFMGNLAMLKILVRDSNEVPDEMRQEIQRAVDERVDWLSKLLAARHAAGEIREVDYDMVARQIMTVNFNEVFSVVTGINVPNNLSNPVIRADVVDFMINTLSPSHY